MVSPPFGPDYFLLECWMEFVETGVLREIDGSKHRTNIVSLYFFNYLT